MRRVYWVCNWLDCREIDVTTLSKDEVVKMAREAGAVFDPRWGVASNIGTATFERFATLCRAPLAAEVERLKKDLSTYDKRIVALSCIAMEDVHELLALQAERDDWKARALKAEQAKKDAERYQWLRKSHHDDDSAIGVTREHMNGWGRVVGKSLRNSDLDKAIDEAIAKEQS